MTIDGGELRCSVHARVWLSFVALPCVFIEGFTHTSSAETVMIKAKPAAVAAVVRDRFGVPALINNSIPALNPALLYRFCSIQIVFNHSAHCHHFPSALLLFSCVSLLLYFHRQETLANCQDSCSDFGPPPEYHIPRIPPIARMKTILAIIPF